jgi:hypothetical protein
MLHSQNPQLAGELAISLMELVLTGEYSSDDFMVQFAMANHSIVAERNQEKYDKKVEASRVARMESLKLNEIAEMLNNGASQRIIADTLGEKATTINYRVGIIRKDYPELLKYSNKNTKNPKNPKDDNVNDNDNDNDNDNYKRGDSPEPPRAGSRAPISFEDMRANSEEEFNRVWGIQK